jgi:hypothetical protein
VRASQVNLRKLEDSLYATLGKRKNRPVPEGVPGHPDIPAVLTASGLLRVPRVDPRFPEGRRRFPDVM